MPQHITLTVDYHDRACVIRRRDLATGHEQLLTEVPTAPAALNRIVDRARLDAGPRGRVTWIQESTTGWARVGALVGDRAEFLLANVLQMPRPPKARWRKTDAVDRNKCPIPGARTSPFLESAAFSTFLKSR